MSLIAQTISALPTPWNVITTLILIGALLVALVAVIIIAIRIIRSGFSFGKFSVKGNSSGRVLVLPEESIDKVFRVFVDAITNTLDRSRNKRTADKMNLAVGKLGGIYTQYKKAFFKVMRDRGVEERTITAHDDYITFDLALRAALYLQNGTECFKSIIKTELKEGSYREKEGKEFQDFVENVGIQLNTIFSKTFEQSYKNSSIFGEANTPTYRVVSLEDIYDIYDSTWDKVKLEIGDIFTGAKEIDNNLEKLEAEQMQDNIDSVKAILMGDVKNDG
jgi:hypothetical protein